MTSLAMIAGMLPIAIGFGEGGEQTAPLARTVVGGLARVRSQRSWCYLRFFAVLQRGASRHPVSLDPDDIDAVQS